MSILPIARRSIQLRVDLIKLKYDGHDITRRSNSIVKNETQIVSIIKNGE